MHCCYHLFTHHYGWWTYNTGESIVKRRIWTISKAILISIVLYMSLLSTLTACTTAPSEIPPPRMVKLLTGEELGPIIGPRKPAVAPNGYTYILTHYDGGLLILDGTEIVKLIPWSDLTDRGMGEQIIAHPTNELVYVSINGTIYIFRDTEHITTIEAEGTRVIDFAVDEKTGYLYTIMGSRPLDGNIPANFIHVISGTQVITTTLIPHLNTQRAVYNPIDGILYLGQSAWPNALESLVTWKLGHGITEPFRDLPVPLGPIKNIVVDRDSGDMYMTNSSGRVGKFTYWNRVDAPITLYVDPFGDNVIFGLEDIGYDQTRDLAYVTATRDTVPSVVLVMRKDEIIAEIPVHYDGADLAIDEKRNYVYVSNTNSRTLSIIRGTEVITTLSTGGRHPMDVTVDEKSGLVYVPNLSNRSVAIFWFEEQYSEAALRWQSFLPLIKKEY